tara:strand:- start:222 stop:1187 length:966 start_codon:yes stop_codon:yes gene_type:complete
MLEKEIIYVASQEMNQSDEIDLIPIWGTVWSYKWVIIGMTLLSTLSAAYIAFNILPIKFKSNAVLQPTAVGNNLSSANLSSIGGNLPIPFTLGGANDKRNSIVNFLNSRTLKKRLIEDHDLLQRFYKNIWDDEAKRWMTATEQNAPSPILAIQTNKFKKIYSVEADKKTGLITISWIDGSPDFTATILQDIIQKLDYYLENEYESDAQKERAFIQRQLNIIEKELEYWEKQVPSTELTLSKIHREQQGALIVFTELRKQLELAKISEVKDVVSFKVLDHPFIPIKKHKPKRILICALVFAFSSVFSSLFVIIIDLVKNKKP